MWVYNFTSPIRCDKEVSNQKLKELKDICNDFNPFEYIDEFDKVFVLKPFIMSWTVHSNYGIEIINEIITTKELNTYEKQLLTDYITGQNSDGFFENGCGEFYMTKDDWTPTLNVQFI